MAFPSQADFKKAADFALGGPVAQITLLTSIVSLARLTFDVLALPFSTLLHNVFAVYRSVFHKPFEVVFGWIDLTIHPWIIDCLILYLILGFVHQKVKWTQLSINSGHPWVVLHNFKNSKMRYRLHSLWELLKSTIAWPFCVLHTIRNPYLIIANGAHGPSGVLFSRVKPAESRHHFPPSAFFLGDARLIMALRFSSAVAGVIAVIALNYAVA